MTSSDSKVDKVQKDFQNLASIAISLNTASDGLTKVVGVLDEALKKLGVGITVWETFSDRGDENNPERYDCDQIGYSKVGSKWGIALRHIWGHEGFNDHNEEGPWQFNDAPREMRLRSVDKIADVIESLAKRAVETTKKIQEKTEELSELADVVSKIANEPKTETAQRKRVATAGMSIEDGIKEVLLNPGIIDPANKQRGK